MQNNQRPPIKISDIKLNPETVEKLTQEDKKLLQQTIEGANALYKDIPLDQISNDTIAELLSQELNEIYTNDTVSDAIFTKNTVSGTLLSTVNFIEKQAVGGLGLGRHFDPQIYSDLGKVDKLPYPAIKYCLGLNPVEPITKSEPASLLFEKYINYDNIDLPKPDPSHGIYSAVIQDYYGTHPDVIQDYYSMHPDAPDIRVYQYNDNFFVFDGETGQNLRVTEATALIPKEPLTPQNRLDPIMAWAEHIITGNYTGTITIDDNASDLARTPEGNGIKYDAYMLRDLPIREVPTPQQILDIVSEYAAQLPDKIAALQKELATEQSEATVGTNIRHISAELDRLKSLQECSEALINDCKEFLEESNLDYDYLFTTVIMGFQEDKNLIEKILTVNAVRQGPNLGQRQGQNLEQDQTKELKTKHRSEDIQEL